MKRNAAKRIKPSLPPTPEVIVAAMRCTVQRVRRMSHRDLVQSLIDTGILTRTGKLAARYR